MKQQSIVVALCLGLAALATGAQEKAGSWVYIGTRNARPPATASADEQAQFQSAQGIYAAHLDAATGKLTLVGNQAELGGAPWLLADPVRPVIYAVDTEGGQESPNNIHSFAVDIATGKLRRINQVVSGAIDATHLVLDEKSRTLFAAGYGRGVVTALPLRPDGGVGDVVSSQEAFGTGPRPRQKTPHSHGVAIDPSGRQLFSADMGADRMFAYRFDAKTRTLTPAQPPFEQFPPGSGPRHIVFHPRGELMILNTEFTAELTVYRWHAKEGRLQRLQTISAYPAGYTDDNRSSAETAFSADGRFFYISLRGNQDSIVVYRVDEREGALEELQRVSSQGKSAWSFAIDPTGRWMVVLNANSSTANVLAIDKATGKLTPTSEAVSVPGPRSIVMKAHAAR